MAFGSEAADGTTLTGNDPVAPVTATVKGGVNNNLTATTAVRLIPPTTPKREMYSSGFVQLLADSIELRIISNSADVNPSITGSSFCEVALTKKGDYYRSPGPVKHIDVYPVNDAAFGTAYTAGFYP